MYFCALGMIILFHLHCSKNMVFLSFFLSTFPDLLVIYILLWWGVGSWFLIMTTSLYISIKILFVLIYWGGRGSLALSGLLCLPLNASPAVSRHDRTSKSVSWGIMQTAAGRLPLPDIDLVGMRWTVTMGRSPITCASVDTCIFPVGSIYILSWVYSRSVHLLFFLSKGFILRRMPFSKWPFCSLPIILGLYNTILSLLTITYFKFIYIYKDTFFSHLYFMSCVFKLSLVINK